MPEKTENLVTAWLDGQLWAKKVEWRLTAGEKWSLIKKLVLAAKDREALGSIGAGPLEDLLYGSSEDFIERLELEAAKSEKFRFSLAIVRNPQMILKDPSRKDEIQQRIDNAVSSLGSLESWVFLGDVPDKK